MGLSWSRVIVSNGSFRDSTAILLGYSGNTYTVSVGARSESFTLSSGSFTSNEKTGSTLTLSGTTYTYTTDDGTVYTLVPWSVDRRQYSGAARVSTIVYPTGEKLTFNWELVQGVCYWNQKLFSCVRFPGERLASVESTNGYKLKFDFLIPDPSQVEGPTPGWATISKVTALNMSVDPASQSWPTLTLNRTSQSNPTITSDTITDSLNRTTTYRFNSAGTLYNIQRPGAATANQTIAHTSGLVSSVSNEGVSTSYSYADANNVRTATISDAAPGNRILATDLSTGLVTSDTNEAGKTTLYEYYSPGGLLKKVTAPEGNAVAYEYDGRGNLTKTTITPKTGSGLPAVVTQASYPASDATYAWKCASTTPTVKCNKPLTTTDALGYVTDYDWDSNTGQLLKVTEPAPTASGSVRPETRYSYSSVYAQYRASGGTLTNFATPVTRLTGVSQCQVGATCAGTADEAKTTAVYGTANALLSSVSSGAGDGSLTATSAFTYDAVGNQLTVDGPLAGTADTTRTRHDAGRQVIGVVGPDPDGGGSLPHRAQRITYNVDGQVTKTEAGTVTSQSDAAWAAFTSAQAAEQTYDTNARPTIARLTSGTTTYSLTQTNYDALGRVDCTAVRMNPAAYASLPASACDAGTAGTDGPDRITKMAYDAVSRPLSVTSGYGTSAAAADATVTYSNNGKVLTLKDAENNLTTNAYDGFDRAYRTYHPVTTKGANASSTTDYEQVTLDSRGSVTAFRNRAGQTIGFTNDRLGRVTYKDLPGTEPDVSYTYDNLDRLKTASQTGNSLSFTWDALGRNLSQAGPHGTTSYSHDAAGRRTAMTYPVGGTALTVNYNWLATSDLASIDQNGAALATYAYDSLGRRSSITYANGVAQSFAYDNASRLTQLTNNPAGTASDLTATFTSNAAGQIASTQRSDAYAWTDAAAVSRSYTSNGLNQYTAAGPATLAYTDARGNLTSVTQSSVTTNYAYSSQNALTDVTGGGVDVDLLYDPLMRLYSVNAVGTLTTKFAYDGLNLIAEYDASGALLRRYIHGPGMDEPLVWFEGQDVTSTSRRYLSRDERGSIIGVSDSTGAALAINSYDEYGIPEGALTQTNTNLGRFQYTGQIWLPEIGLYHYKARAYSPTLGRFMQPDPIGVEGGINLYGYTGNDPVNLVDPLGLKWVWACVGPDKSFLNCGFRWQAEPANVMAGYLPLGGRWAGSPRRGSTGVKRSTNTCAVILAERGNIYYSGTAKTVSLLLGYTQITGTFQNTVSGSSGEFRTYGLFVGAGLGIANTSGNFRSLRDFIGYSETAEGSVSFLKNMLSVDLSMSTNVNNELIGGGSGASLRLPSPSGNPLSGNRLSLGASATETSISNCRRG